MVDLRMDLWLWEVQQPIICSIPSEKGKSVHLKRNFFPSDGVFSIYCGEKIRIFSYISFFHRTFHLPCLDSLIILSLLVRGFNIFLPELDGVILSYPDYRPKLGGGVDPK
jgi:hypothetical protein